MCKHAHHDIVVPAAVRESCFPFPALDDEAAFFVSSDGALIVGNYTDSNPMELQVDKCVSQKHENSFTA